MKVSDNELVFGLDIGTRNIVGTVGYRDMAGKFNVIAMHSKEHESRAMLDGQIHDIGRVAKTISEVKKILEEQIENNLKEVCIAAAGRVLKTVTTTVEHEFTEETLITEEIIHTLDLMGVEKAQEILREQNDTKFRFYCVGYTAMRYYIGDEIISNLLDHKAEIIKEDLIVTFLPEDVVDGLYKAVDIAGLEVANLTLEPIAAINVAIPESFRMLNIALVDIGAGTSDICITRDGSIIAYGMIPIAGDEITEMLVQNYLVEFNQAEHIKLASGTDEEITFEDIMCIEHKIKAEEVWNLTAPYVDRMAKEIALKIKELNDGKSVSACFVVGGGGKVHGFTEKLAEELELVKERVALRGEEVLRSVNFMQDEVKKDPLVVTPVGICLSYYEQQNSFIMLRFNGERIKLYDNNHLTVVDAAMQAGFPNESLFARSGKAIKFTVNGKTRMIRGGAGEPCEITLNGKEVNINTPIEPNCEIVIKPSTKGEDAVCTIDSLEEYALGTIEFEVNKRIVSCQRFAEVNGQIVDASYQIKDGDRVEILNYYTIKQLADFLNVKVDTERDIIVNNRIEGIDSHIYENFAIEFTVKEEELPEEEIITNELPKEDNSKVNEGQKEETQEEVKDGTFADKNEVEPETESKEEVLDKPEAEKPQIIRDLTVNINGDSVTMKGKAEYAFTDIFDYIDFDLADSRGRTIVTLVNGETASYIEPLKEGDKIEIRWE